jgi:hypothetical protein
VTRSQSPLDAALDLLVYVPVGLLVTAAEEVPRLAAKGRARIGGQVGMARVVGQFAVAQGRKELSKRLSAPAGGGGGGPAGEWVPGRGDGRESGFAPGEPVADDAGEDVAPGPVADPRADPVRPVSEADGGRQGPSSASGAHPARGDGPPGAPRAPGIPPSRPSALAIPGYDSLAASQVVPRLAGLSPEELTAVGAYETAHRARRTILTRVRQLQER